MTPLFSVEMLPAREGDCLWISYGDPARPRHVLIDGGRKATASVIRARLAALPPDQRRLELIVVTHIDRDHIEGLLHLLEGGLEGIEVGDLWFNGYRHLSGDLTAFGAAQGERFTAAIEACGLSWNRAFGGAAAVTGPAPPTVTLPGGMAFTLLSPTREKLAALRPVWDRECAKAGLVPGRAGRRESPEGIESFGGLDLSALADSPFGDDQARANGSSIALLARFDGRSLLLAADAHAGLLTASLATLGDGAPLALDAFKVPHHGSGHNLSKELLAAVQCDRYLISTNGSYFDHPDRSAIARIIRYGGSAPELLFNYRTGETAIWDDAALQARHGYRCRYPQAGAQGSYRVSL